MITCHPSSNIARPQQSLYQAHLAVICAQREGSFPGESCLKINFINFPYTVYQPGPTGVRQDRYPYRPKPLSCRRHDECYISRSGLYVASPRPARSPANGFGIIPLGIMLKPCSANVQAPCIRYTDDTPVTKSSLIIRVIFMTSIIE